MTHASLQIRKLQAAPRRITGIGRSLFQGAGSAVWDLRAGIYDNKPLEILLRSMSRLEPPQGRFRP